MTETPVMTVTPVTQVTAVTPLPADKKVVIPTYFKVPSTDDYQLS